MNDALNGKPERSLDDLVGAATGDLRVELATLDVVPFRPTRRRSPLVAGVATIVVVAGAAVWVSRPSAETVVSSPAPPASSGPLATDDQPGSTISSPTRSTAPVVVATPVRDLDVRVPEPLDRPGQNEPFTDPVFGQSISRMTDSTAGEYIAPLTTLTSAFNADETKLLVYRTTNDGGGEHRVLDLTSGASTSIDIAPSDIEEVAWSPTEPDTLIYVDGIDLARYDVRSQTSEVITTFDECEGMATAVGGNGLSVDGDVMPLACLAQSGDSLLAYRFSTGMATAVPREQNPELFTQAPRVAPSGERFVFPTANRVGTVLDASLRPTGVEIDPLTTTAQDSSGADLAVGPSYSGDFAGALVATDLATAMIVMGLIRLALGLFVALLFTERNFTPVVEHRFAEARAIFTEGVQLARHDSQIFLVSEPEYTKKQLLLHAAHQFIEGAHSAGAAGALVSDLRSETQSLDLPQVLSVWAHLLACRQNSH